MATSTLTNLAPLGAAPPPPPPLPAADDALAAPPPPLDDLFAGVVVGAAAEDDDDDDPPPPPPGSPPTATDRGRGDGGAAGRVPWRVPPRHVRSHLVRLHNELVDFACFMAPTPAEDAARAAAVDRLARVAAALWPAARVAVFGSTATRLHLPSSDVDAVVLGTPTPTQATTTAPAPAGGGSDRGGGGNPPSAARAPPDPRLKLLAAGLLRAGAARDLTLVTRARVPLVKYVDVPSGIAIDASFDVDGGPAAAAAAAARLASVPPARPLVAFLKTVLHQRGLNEVYSGGLGSHALLVMVLAFLGGHPSRRPRGGGGARGRPPAPSSLPAPLTPNLGALLLDFCDVFGRRLDAAAAGVCAGPRGAFYDKAAAGHGRPDRPWALAVRDPDDPGNDLAAGSFHIHRVRAAFEHVGRALAVPAPPDARRRESLLARVVRVDAGLAARAGPARSPTPPAAARGGGGGSHHHHHHHRTEPRPPRKRKEREAAFDEEGGCWASPPASARRRASEGGREARGRDERRRSRSPRRRHIRFD